MEPAGKLGILSLHAQERQPVGAVTVGAQLLDHLNLAVGGRDDMA